MQRRSKLIEKEGLNVQKSYGQNYQPVKIKVKFGHKYWIRILFSFFGVAFIVLGVLTICGY